MNYPTPYYNPFPQQPIIQPTQVVRVNGENGARSYTIGANSSALLLDESGLMVWLVTSDGAGYKTVTPYDITPHQVQPAPDFGSLESSGLGHRPLTAVTGVRLPYRVPKNDHPSGWSFFVYPVGESNRSR